MIIKEGFHQAVDQAHKELIGIQGKREAQKRTEQILDRYDLKFAKATRPTYTAYFIEVDSETGGSCSLFIGYNTQGKVKKITTM